MWDLDKQRTSQVKRRQTKEKPTKREMSKSYTTLLKDIEWPDQLSTKRKRIACQLALKKGPNTLHSVKYKSLQKRKWKLAHDF